MSASKAYKNFLIFECPVLFNDQPTGGQHVLHIDRKIISEGLFRSLPPFELLTYFIILTWMDRDKNTTISLSELRKLLGGDEERIYMALGYLEKRSYIQIHENPLCINNANFKITVKKLPSLTGEMPPAWKEGMDKEQFEEEAAPEDDFLQAVIKQNAVSSDELVQALISLFKPTKITYQLREELNDWITAFETPMIQELIRRTQKKVEADPTTPALAYARGIVQNWYEEGISTYKELQAADKLYREIQELAAEYGLPYSSLKPPQKRILRSWMMESGEDDFALSKEVCKLAIQRAFKEKRDGQPSLDYIENNYIKPLKRSRAKNTEEARRVLNDKSSPVKTRGTAHQKSNKKYKWEDFFWDFDKFKEK